MLGIAPIVGANVSISCGATSGGGDLSGVVTKSQLGVDAGRSGLSFLRGVSLEGVPTASLLSTTGGTYLTLDSPSNGEPLLTFAMNNQTPPHHHVASHCDVVTTSSQHHQQQQQPQHPQQPHQRREHHPRVKIEASSPTISADFASSSHSGVRVKLEPSTSTPGSASKGRSGSSSSSSKNGASTTTSPRVFYIQTRDGEITLPDKLRQLAATTQQVSCPTSPAWSSGSALHCGWEVSGSRPGRSRALFCTCCSARLLPSRDE